MCCSATTPKIDLSGESISLWTILKRTYRLWQHKFNASCRVQNDELRNTQMSLLILRRPSLERTDASFILHWALCILHLIRLFSCHKEKHYETDSNSRPACRGQIDGG